MSLDSFLLKRLGTELSPCAHIALECLGYQVQHRAKISPAELQDQQRGEKLRSGLHTGGAVTSSYVLGPQQGCMFSCRVRDGGTSRRGDLHSTHLAFPYPHTHTHTHTQTQRTYRFLRPSMAIEVERDEFLFPSHDGVVPARWARGAAGCIIGAPRSEIKKGERGQRTRPADGRARWLSVN